MRTLFVVAVLLVGLALAGGTAVGQPGTPLEGDGAAVTAVDEGNNSSASNGSVGFGSSVSSFIQSTAAETNTAVDQGIWEASVEGNATVEQARNRAARLGERVAELRAQRARLAKLRSNGTISLPTYVARDARLRAELRSLGAAANQTQQVAPNATAVQQSLAIVERAADAASGPPDEIANRTGAPLNIPGVADGAENGSAPGETPANASNESARGEGPANGSNGEGPPSDAGNGQSNGAGNSSNGAGNGNGAGDGNGGSGTTGNENGGNETDGGGSDGSGTAGANDSSSSSSNNANSSGTGSDTDGSSAGTAGDSSSGANGGAAGSAGGSDDGAGDSEDSGTKTQPDPPGNPGPKSN
ncbi:MAG: hypothetical protein ABEH81_10425 [Halopenitus sp.]